MRCVLKRMLPMSRSSGVEGRLEVCFYRCNNCYCTCCNFDVLLGALSRVLVVVNIIWCCLTDELGYGAILLSLWFAATPPFLF